MSGLFEHLAAEQTEERNASRRAVIVAKARVEERLGSFLRAAADADEYAARLDLVSDDLSATIVEAASEYALAPQDTTSILATIIEHFRPAAVTAKTAAIQVEARKPK